MSFSNQIKFDLISKLLEHVSNSNVVKKREEYFRDFFKQLENSREKFRRENPKENSSVLPIIRLILSQEEKERSYGIQEKSLRQLYIKVIGLGKTNQDYDKIMKSSEDELPNMIGEVLRSRLSEKDGKLTVEEVDNLLHFFSDNQKSSLQEKELNKLYLHASALDHKWICRMILKRMCLNFGTTKILRALHPNAPELFKQHNHLSRVIEMIDNGMIETTNIVETVQPFTTIKSMLCEKISNANKSVLSNPSKSFYQETKMDGERFHLHYNNNVYKYISRNGKDYSAGFNELLTPLIKFSPVVNSLILDGEMMVYDTNQRIYYTKGDTSVDVKSMKSDKKSNLRPCYCVFDILYYNGVNLMTKPYHHRIDILSELFTDREGVLVKTKPTKIRDLDDIITQFNIAIEKNEEGIVVKESMSLYRPGERGGGWYKIKADYFDGDLVTDFDVVVIGGYFENPNAKNYIEKYMVGAIEKVDGKFNVHAIGEVFSGLSRQERMHLDQYLKQNAVTHCGETEIKFEHGSILFGNNKPHVWIPPDKSVVLECRASELVRCKANEQKTSYTFRFPRITDIRKDKTWEESCTLKEFEELYQGQEKSGKVQKLTKRNATTSDMQSPSRKKKTVQYRKDMLKNFQNINKCNQEDEAYDNVLEGKEFCVKSSDDSSISISEIQNMITRHGGTFVQHPRKAKTFAIVCGHVSNDVKTYIKNKSMNVIKSAWVIRELRNEALSIMPKLRPKFDLVFATDELMRDVTIYYDEFGDSYTDEIESIEELKEILSLNAENGVEIGAEEIADLENELEEVCGLKNINIFRTFHGHFISNSRNNHALNYSEQMFKLYKGNVTKEREGPSKMLLFYDKTEMSGNIEISAKSPLIDHMWILDSIHAGKLLNKEEYI